MDLFDAIRRRINILENGEYISGLKAVMLHIETAFRHLSRGQETGDETAFTDTIYRTNQAFEGSVKEAYRVLADQDPAKKSPHEIEKYLEKNGIFRDRVLKQLTTYRTEWRNPSTHNYRLDFDENEAFLAIVSVSAFSCLLLDQIAEHLAYKRARAETNAQDGSLAATLATDSHADLLVRATRLLDEFCSRHLTTSTSRTKLSESQVIGAIHGFLSSAAPGLTVQAEANLLGEPPVRADLLIVEGHHRIVVEIKRRLTRESFYQAVGQMNRYLSNRDVTGGVILFLPNAPSEMKVISRNVVRSDVQLIILFPADSSIASELQLAKPPDL